MDQIISIFVILKIVVFPYDLGYLCFKAGAGSSGSVIVTEGVFEDFVIIFKNLVLFVLKINKKISLNNVNIILSVFIMKEYNFCVGSF